MIIYSLDVLFLPQFKKFHVCKVYSKTLNLRKSVWNHFSKTRNKIRMPLLTITIQYSIPSPTLAPMEMKYIKSIEIRKVEVTLEKAMAPHSSTLAWKIPWTEEPGRLQSMGSLRVGHDWVTSLWLFTFMHWRRKWQPIPVFLPRESQGWGSLVGCRLWGHKESDMTEAT